MKNSIKLFSQGLLLMGALSMTACTGWFDNVPPYEATDDMLDGDNVKIGAFFPQLQRNVISTHNNQFQISENLIGDIYSGYMAIPTNFNSNKNNATYFFQDNWLNMPFEKVYTQAMGAYMEIRRNTGADENSHVYQWAQILKIASMHRFTDIWGPLPYTQVGGSMTVSYDSQEAVYMRFFEELDKAVEVLSKFTANNPGSKPMAEYDLVYGGDYAKWVKFANSLHLRLAMRLAYIKPDVAQQEAEKAVAQPGGLITSNDDNAGVKSVGANDVVNQLYTMWAQYQDIRMGASILSILDGYDDPRLGKMFTQGKVNGKDGYFALRTGLNLDDNKNSRLGYSSPNIQANTPIVWMNAAEVAFLKAEGALRGWNMGGVTAQAAYEEGIALSFAEWGAGSPDAYKADSEKTAANYVDPLSSSNNINAVSNITIAWEDNGDKNKNLERIITQKWIAMFPNGLEAWTEYRRTDYPKLFPVKVNNSAGTVDTDIQIRRMPFAKSEYTLNPDNINAAIGLLGGPDTGGTRLWWDVENKSVN